MGENGYEESDGDESPPGPDEDCGCEDIVENDCELPEATRDNASPLQENGLCLVVIP